MARGAVGTLPPREGCFGEAAAETMASAGAGGVAGEPCDAAAAGGDCGACELDVAGAAGGELDLAGAASGGEDATAATSAAPSSDSGA